MFPLVMMYERAADAPWTTAKIMDSFGLNSKPHIVTSSYFLCAYLTWVFLMTFLSRLKLCFSWGITVFLEELKVVFMTFLTHNA